LVIVRNNKERIYAESKDRLYEKARKEEKCIMYEEKENTRLYKGHDT